MRKEADFELTNRIHIAYECDDKLDGAIREHLDYLKTETLATEVIRGKGTGEKSAELTINGLSAKVIITRTNT
jgi:isoleucyl-tRNA synthetase